MPKSSFNGHSWIAAVSSNLWSNSLIKEGGKKGGHSPHCTRQQLINAATSVVQKNRPSPEHLLKKRSSNQVHR